MKIAWFQGDVQTPEWEYDGTDDPKPMSQDEILALPKNSPQRPVLRILLVPDDVDLSVLSGDDWNDAPANCNASEPYDAPEGSRWIEIGAGDAWPDALAEAFWDSALPAYNPADGPPVFHVPPCTLKD